jgi:hypothetical protein
MKLGDELRRVRPEGIATLDLLHHSSRELDVRSSPSEIPRSSPFPFAANAIRRYEI